LFSSARGISSSRASSRSLRGVARPRLRVWPRCWAGHAGGQHQAVAVEDAAAVGRQLQRAREAHLALALEEVVAEHLDPPRAPGQAHKASATAATMNLLRHTGVRLASSGLEV
jgi:hypothetical protein